MTPLSHFMSGLIVMGFSVAGLFFLRFWVRTRDALFATFAAAFWMFALNQALVATLGVVQEERSWIYLLRLAAFLLIIIAVLAKNLAGPSPGSRFDPRRRPRPPGG